MRKILFLFGVFALLLSSCASDDNLPDGNNLIFPKTVSYTYPEFPGDNSKDKMTYNGNKIVTSIDEKSKIVYTYDGNRIIKQEKFKIDAQGNQSKSIEVLYTYENGKLKTRIMKEIFSSDYPQGQYMYKTVYAHETDAQISYVFSSVDVDTNVEKKRSTGILTYKDGNLIKRTQVGGAFGGGSNSSESRSYEYDTKINPLKNILGFNLLLDEIGDFGKNNVIKTILERDGFPNPAIFLTNHIYNDKGYPIKSTSLTGNGKTIEYEIEYEY
ncbi:hypothetical protein [Flavobacterium poyangense]|uniref:hypothetical protein n=1 Tax=Flavobacterium poyangense TaxID=2204302 RepID=UPI00141FC8BA|nr:hypothetical protein [Flavobacterium sp. JXAS1]